MAGAQDHLEGGPEARRVEELAEHAWIAFSQLTSPWSLRFRVGRRDVPVQVRRPSSVTMCSAGRALALAGAGIYGAPDFTLHADVQAGRLVRLFPQARLPPVFLYAAWPGRMEPPAKTRALIDLAKLRLRGRLAV